MDWLTAIIVAHAVSTMMMTGLIWFVQLVHYPLMGHVGESGFADYEAQHTRRTTWIVAPLMLVELLSASALLVCINSDSGRMLAGVGFAFVVLNWVSTAFIQVPCHRKLTEGFDANAVDRLVATNWIRTVAWTLRAVIVVAIWYVI
ncbi:MAG: hypothetical protein DHS20C16_20770 [Phycisphaerae bacterium]|nr:MAG: hypothetical protein DHS20C16_20770 [Phycisphaerae bacterium]